MKLTNDYQNLLHAILGGDKDDSYLCCGWQPLLCGR